MLQYLAFPQLESGVWSVQLYTPKGTQKHFDHFWELNFEALEADGGQNAPETSGEVGLSWEWSRKIPGKILTYLDTKKVQIRPF